MLIRVITHILILAVLTFVHGCASESKITSNKLPLACGDLFSLYANKPVNLEFKHCANGSGPQKLLEAKYFASSDNADEIEELLVNNYGLMNSCDYYHSMPTNEINIQPKKLLEINPYYVLYISVTHRDIEALIYGGCNKERNKEFVVTVSILEV